MMMGISVVKQSRNWRNSKALNIRTTNHGREKFSWEILRHLSIVTYIDVNFAKSEGNLWFNTQILFYDQNREM